MTVLKASQTRIPTDAFNRVAYQHERIRVERRGSNPVFLVCAEDMARIEELEDQYWSKEGQKALKEFHQSGQKSIPLKKVKEKLGI